MPVLFVFFWRQTLLNPNNKEDIKSIRVVNKKTIKTTKHWDVSVHLEEHVAREIETFILRDNSSQTFYSPMVKVFLNFWLEQKLFPFITVSGFT